VRRGRVFDDGNLDALVIALNRVLVSDDARPTARDSKPRVLRPLQAFELDPIGERVVAQGTPL